VPSERFADALNAQVGREFAAAHQYLAIAAHYDAQTYPRLARFFYDQAEEERGHGMKMVEYLLQTGTPLELGQIPAPQREFEDHVAPIRLALEQERRVSIYIGELFQIARETGDPASEIFMQGFIDEQVEEEDSMESLLEVAERVREYPMMLEEFLARDADHLGKGSD
jgi:ferritin